MERIHTKIIKGCVGCPHHCGEGEFCKHPDRERNHVIYNYPLPDDCPLPKNVEDGRTCTEPREFYGNGLVIICKQCEKPVIDRRAT